MNNRLVWVLESYNLLNDLQCGGRKNKGTLNSILTLQNNIISGFNRGESTIAVTIDIEKAFDRCWNHKIKQNLIRWNIGGRLFNFISDMFVNRRICQV